MTSGQDLYLQLQDKLRSLEAALVELPKRGRASAQTERDYRIALAQETLRLRESGQPATIIGDLVRGNREIAKLRFERDVAQTIYEAAQETIRVWKLEATLMEAQMQREWTRRE
mgnify:FL=1